MNRSWARRSQYTSDQRAALLAEFRNGGETQKEFAQRHGIKWTTFRNWLYPCANKKLAKTPLRLREIPVDRLLSGSEWDAEIAFSGGTVVRLKSTAHPAWVSSIIQPLRQPC